MAGQCLWAYDLLGSMSSAVVVLLLRVKLPVTFCWSNMEVAGQSRKMFQDWRVEVVRKLISS